MKPIIRFGVVGQKQAWQSLFIFVLTLILSIQFVTGRNAMFRIYRSFTFVLILLLPSVAQATSSAPSLVGTWISVVGEVGHWGGTLKPFGEQVGTLVVEEQLGGIFRGTMSYQNEKSGPKFEGKKGIHHIQSEPVLGVIDWDNRSIVWVDHEDETVHRARLKNESTMEVIAFEPGAHAVVNRMIMVRQ